MTADAVTGGGDPSSGMKIWPRLLNLSHPARVEKAGELVRVDLNLSDGMAGAPAVRSFLRVELESFIIGGGQVTVQDTAEGGVIARRDEGKIDRLHSMFLSDCDPSNEGP
jgi:hypothetical protein